MLKRPLCFVVGAYILGLFASWFSISLLWVVLFLLGYLLGIVYLVRVKIIDWLKDGFLWFLPIMVLFGMVAMGQAMKPIPLNQIFEKEITCNLVGEIAEIIQKSWGTVLYVRNNEITLEENEVYYSEQSMVYLTDTDFTRQKSSRAKEYRIGNRIAIQGKLMKFTTPSNPGQFNEAWYYRVESVDYKIKANKIEVIDDNYSVVAHILGRFKERMITVYETILSAKESGVIVAMLLGEKYLLDEEISQLYQSNGIAHILAISGVCFL